MTVVHRIIPHGAGFGGALRYVIQTRQGTVIDSSFAPGARPNQMAAEMYDVARQNSRVEKPVGHFVLSLAPGESLSDAEWSQAARRYLHHLGYTDNPFAVVRHHNTDNDHVHIILSRVQWDGRCTSTSNDRHRGHQALRAIEKEFGLSSPSGRGQQRDSIPGPQLHAAIRKDEPNYSHALRGILREAAAGQPDLTRFFQRLEDAGVRARLNRASTGHVSGIVYEYGPLTVAGRQLGRDFSWRGLQDRLGVRVDPEGDREALRRHQRVPPSDGPGAGTSAWSRSARQALKEELRTIPVRRGTPLREAQASLGQPGPLSALVQAGYLLQSLRSPTRALREVLRRTPGLAGLNQVFAFAGALRSPAAALSLGLTLLHRSVRSRRSAALERTLLHAFSRAAAADFPTPETMDARLSEAGIRRGPLGRLELAESFQPAPLRWIEPSQSTETNVRVHLAALGGDRFDLRVSGGPFRKPMILARLGPHEVLEKIQLYRAWNATGARIEVRPHDRAGLHAVRNVTAEQLQAASALGFRPVAVVQISPPSAAPINHAWFRFSPAGSQPGADLQLYMRRAYGLLFDRQAVRTLSFAPLAGFTVEGRFTTVAAADGGLCPRSARLLGQLEAYRRAEEIAVTRTLSRLGVPTPREFARSLGRSRPSRSTDVQWARRALAAGAPSEAVWRALAFEGSRSRSLPVKQIQHATRALRAARAGQGLQQAAGLALSLAASALGVPTALLRIAGLALDLLKGMNREI